MLLDHDGYLPSFACITDGKKADVQMARIVSLATAPSSSMDRGYNDYRTVRQLDRTGSIL